jgi:hypothetical protein
MTTQKQRIPRDQLEPEWLPQPHPRTIPAIEAIVMIILLVLLTLSGWLTFPYH